MLISPNMMLSFTGPLPVHCGGGRRPGSLADAPHDCSTSEAFLPTTVLTENLCRCVQQILWDCMPTTPFLTKSTITLNFLPGFSSSPGWLLLIWSRRAWWCRFRQYCRSRLTHLSPRSRVCAQQWYGKDIHSHMHSHPPMHTPKTKKEQNPKLTKHDVFVDLSSSCPRWWWATASSFADAPQDCSTSETFSPRTVLTENICRCVQHFPTTISFLTTSTTTFSCLASAARQADSWSLGHVEPDDVVIADIGGQALDIFLHGPESAHKNGIVKTFTHTSIPIHPCILLKKKVKKEKKKTITKCSTHQTWCFHLLVLFLSTVAVGDGQVAWQMLRMTAPHRWPSCLRQYWQKTFVGVFNKYSKIACQQCHL